VIWEDEFVLESTFVDSSSNGRNVLCSRWDLSLMGNILRSQSETPQGNKKVHYTVVQVVVRKDV
jgi:hypothetical protein